MAKKEWQQPVLEVLNVSMTMAGVGSKYVDYVTADNYEEILIEPSSPIVFFGGSSPSPS